LFKKRFKIEEVKNVVKPYFRFTIKVFKYKKNS